MQQPASLPVRGAWIEIRTSGYMLPMSSRRSPCGERGLKFGTFRPSWYALKSLPVRGAWIEIAKVVLRATTSEVAPRAGSVD